MSINAQTFKNLTCGLYVLTVAGSDKNNGCIINTTMQVTSDPPCLSVTVNKNAKTAEMMNSVDKFGISVLEKDLDMSVIKRFGFATGKTVNKFDNYSGYKVVDGVPVVTENSCAYFTLEKVSTADVGTHTIYIGKILSAELLSDAAPITYADYHKLKNGFTPPSAPSFIPPSKR